MPEPMPDEERRQMLEELAALRRQLADADARIRQLEAQLQREGSTPTQVGTAESP